MMKFTRFAQAAACIIVLTASNAGDAAEFSRFVSALPDARAEFEYAYRLSSGNTEMSGSGSVIFQGDAFVMKGDGLEVYCDGTDRWTVDRNAREAVAELFDRDNMDIFSNPALMAVNADGFFTAVSESSVSSNGKDIVRTVLAPKSNTGRVSSAFLDFSVGDGIPVPVGAHLSMEDGSVLDISISGFECMPAGDISFFSFDAGSLGEDFVVTDLR